MKARPADRMRDPFFAQLMFLIEQMICAADRDAAERGVILKDSQVQSALTKAKGLAAGKAPKIGESTEAERILKELIMSINQAPQNMIEQSIEAVVDSIKTRRSGLPGSRDYLDFVQEFVARAKERQ